MNTIKTLRLTEAEHAGITRAIATGHYESAHAVLYAALRMRHLGSLPPLKLFRWGRKRKLAYTPVLSVSWPPEFAFLWTGDSSYSEVCHAALREFLAQFEP